MLLLHLSSLMIAAVSACVTPEPCSSSITMSTVVSVYSNDRRASVDTFGIERAPKGDSTTVLTEAVIDTLSQLLTSTKAVWNDPDAGELLECKMATGGRMGLTSVLLNLHAFADTNPVVSKALQEAKLSASRFASLANLVCESVTSSSVLKSTGGTVSDAPTSVIGKNIVFVRAHPELIQRLKELGLIPLEPKISEGRPR